MSIKIIIIDDDKDMLRVASAYLRKEDPTFDIDCTHSVEESLRLMSLKDYDVIVCDYEMPGGMSGLDLLAMIRTQNNDTPFIVFTGQGREEVAIKALNLGADSYITKSEEPRSLYTELAYTIRNVVSHKRARMALDESDARFRAAFEDAAIGMAIISIDQEILQVNDTLCEMLGFPEEQLIGRNLEEIAHPEEIGQAPIKALHVLDEGDPKVLSGERRFLHSDGKWVWTRTTSSLTRDSTGNPLYFVSQFQDITETKIAIEALRDSEERFRGAFEDAAIGMALVSVEEENIQANHALTQMLGYSNEELNERSFNEITHPDDLDKTPTLIDGKFNNGKTTIQLEKRYIHKSGHIVYTFISSSILFDSEGNPTYFVSQFQDITEQRLASQALEQSENNYRNLVEQSLQNYTIIQDGKYVFVNKAFQETVGRTQEELLSLSSEEIWDLIHPEDLELLKERNQRLQEGSEHVPKVQFRYVRPDGEIRWVEGLVRQSEYDGKPSLQAVEIDITEKKAIDGALRDSLDFLDTLLNTIPNPVFFKDLSGTYQKCNPSFASKIMGLPIEDVPGKNVYFLLDRILSIEKQGLDKMDKDLLETQKDQVTNVQIETPEGSLRDYIVNRSVYRDTYGNSLGIVGVMQDITSIRQLQADLERQKEELSEFAQVMSHDLQGLIHNALLYAEIQDVENEKKNLEGIKKALSTAQDILQRSLKLAEAGLVIGDKEDVDLNKLVDEIANREVPKSIHFERDKLPTIECDRLKMTQIITNLLKNAVEHGKPENIEIRLKTTSEFHDISIINDGKEIPEDPYDNIFAEKINQHMDRGLGLKIVHKIVQAHGWSIALVKDDKVIFRIRIPIVESGDQADGPE